MTVWLIVGEVGDNSHVAEDDRCVQGLDFVCFSVCAKCCKYVVLRGVVRWGVCILRYCFPLKIRLRCLIVVTMVCAGSEIVGVECLVASRVECQIGCST